MENRSNTIIGWVLGSMMALLAFVIASQELVKPIKAEKAGYPIEVPLEAAGGGAAVPDKPIAELLATADVTHGAEVFKKCGSCHSIAQGGANGIGPNLWATVGEAIAQGKAGYPFSDALKTAGTGKKWDFEELNKWLTSPRVYANGTKMSFAGLESGKDRADVILYLNSQGSNLPLPAPPAATGSATDAKVPPAIGPATPGGKAAPSATDLSNSATPASGAPSIDPAASKK